MENYVLKISYNGGNFCGWQKQNNKPSVQQTLETAISSIFNKQIDVIGCGRTDSGVSAISYIANFKIDNLDTTLFKFRNRLNSILPDTVRVLDVFKADDNFHARFSAKTKTYAYNFYLSDVSIPYFDLFATQIKQKIDIEVFKRNSKMLIGTHNFASFCASNTQVQNKTRTIYDVSLIQNNNLYTLLISGNGFLFHMVRNIMGTLVDVSCGKIDKNVTEIINLADRKYAGFCAPSTGLVLVGLNYNEK